VLDPTQTAALPFDAKCQSTSSGSVHLSSFLGKSLPG